MHKDKKGRVLASLTEVKNKTGDIFALVDEFNEVFITSYNKTRYRISKMDISALLDEEKTETKKIVRDQKPSTKRDEERSNDLKDIVEEEVKTNQQFQTVNNIIDTLNEQDIKLTEVEIIDQNVVEVWNEIPTEDVKEETEESRRLEIILYNRESGNERAFIENALQPLVNN